MKLLQFVPLAALLAAASFAASPAPKSMGTVAGVVIDSSVSRDQQTVINRLLKTQRIEAGQPVDSRQFMMAAALVNEATDGQYSAVWRKPSGKQELTLYIERNR